MSGDGEHQDSPSRRLYSGEHKKFRLFPETSTHPALAPIFPSTRTLEIFPLPFHTQVEGGQSSRVGLDVGRHSTAAAVTFRSLRYSRRHSDGCL